MGRQFFTRQQISTSVTARQYQRLPQCGMCGLFKRCVSPKMPPSGKGKKGILVIAEAPGSQEDHEGTQLIGAAGKRLRRLLNQLNISLDDDCWKTNAVCCRPIGNRDQNVKPLPKQIEACRPTVLKAIHNYKPKVIILLGESAVASLIGWLWKSDVGPIGRWTGWRIPCRQFNCWIIPTWHPSYLLRMEAPALEVLMQQHLETAVSAAKAKRPFEKAHIYNPSVRTIIDPNEAAEAVDHIAGQGKLIAFDFETNCLKPEHPQARILSCGISNGYMTVAFPWVGRAVSATKALLQSDIPKTNHNMKFEERWARLHAGGPVRNWRWCSMLTAHCLDNRQGVCSLKFQAFARLGIGDYDSHVGKYKESGPDGLNKMDRLELRDLLQYNGMDAIVAWELARLQMKEL